MKWLLLLLVPVAALWAAPVRAEAKCFTTDGTPALANALDEWAAVANIRNCGASASPSIRMVPPLAAASASSAFPVPGGCAIALLPGAEELLVHEVGHCLGLDHNDDRTSVMSRIPAGRYVSPQAPDIVAIQLLYGPPVRTYRLAVAVGRD